MAAICPNPSVVNPLQSTGFILNIAKIPEISFWCKSVTIPSITLGEATHETPFTVLYQPGTRPEFTGLNVSILVDAEMNNYAAMYEWMTLIGFAETTDDINQWKRRFIDQSGKNDANIPPLVSDGFLDIIGGNQKPVRRLKFRDMWPTSIDGFEISEDTTETTYLTFQVSLRFTGKPVLTDFLQLPSQLV